MDEDTATANLLVFKLRKGLTDVLRTEFPYMKLAAVDETSRRVSEELSKGIVKAKPQMAESKSRSDFFKLPTEMHNEIFELALLSLPPDPLDIFKELKATGRKPRKPIIANFAFLKILHASQEIRREMLPMFLSRLEIRVSMNVDMRGPSPSTARCHSDQAPLSKHWIAGLGKEASKYIKAFHLYIEGLCLEGGRSDGLKLPETNEEIFEDLGFNKTGIQNNAMEIYLLDTTEGPHVLWRKRE